MTQSYAKLTRCAPYFPVADVESSVTYYQNVMGFSCDYTGGEPPIFSICSRDGHALMFRKVDDPALIRPSEKQGGTWDAFFWVEGLDALHAELAEKGADIVYGPIIQDAYNMNEFAIRDQDGHILGFGESR